MMCEEGGREAGEARAVGLWCCDSRRPPGLHGADASSHHAVTISGLRQGRAMPVLPPGRKSLTVTPCCNHSLVEAFPWQAALHWSLPSLQCSPALSSLLHLLHLLSHAPAMGNPSWDFLILPNPCASITVSSPWGTAAGRSLLAHGLSLAGTGTGTAGPGLLPSPGLGHCTGAQHTPGPGGTRSELPEGQRALGYV